MEEERIMKGVVKKIVRETKNGDNDEGYDGRSHVKEQKYFLDFFLESCGRRRRYL